MDALFERQEEHFLPTGLSVGPWSPNALHGGPVAALLARSLESEEGGESKFVARLTVELLRPVPLAPLALSTRFSRPGKKVQLVEARLDAEGKEVARATALRIRRGEVPIPDDLPIGPDPLPGPESATEGTTSKAKYHDGFHNLSVEHRFLKGSFHIAGPAIDWIRLKVPVLADEEPSPLCRVAAVADFGNGVSSMLRRTHTYINPDFTLYLHRYPEGEWVCLDAESRVEPTGVGFAESALRDRRGRIGRALQSLIVELRG